MRQVAGNFGRMNLLPPKKKSKKDTKNRSKEKHNKIPSVERRKQ